MDSVSAVFHRKWLFLIILPVRSIKVYNFSAVLCPSNSKQKGTPDLFPGRRSGLILCNQKDHLVIQRVCPEEEGHDHASGAVVVGFEANQHALVVIDASGDLVVRRPNNSVVDVI